MATETFPSWQSYEYVQVSRIVEMRDGCVYKTEPKGFAKALRPQQADEVYSSLSTKLLRQPTITLELLE
jgi:hypothetical protein